MPDATALKVSKDMINFIDVSYSAAHAVQECARRLSDAGFSEINESSQWSLGPGDKFFVIRRFTSIVAGKIGTVPFDEGGFRIIGAHTDSPGFRLKPNTLYNKSGYVQMGVEIYGGPILASFADRDLGIAGRLVVENSDAGGYLDSVLVALNEPVCRIPNVAIHLNREVNNEGLKLHKQNNLPPIVGLSDGTEISEFPLITKLAETANVDPSAVRRYSLELFDIQPGAIGGLFDDFVFSRRIDNLASCHAAIEAIINSPDDTEFSQIVALFDSEEVGSATYNGAASTFLDDVLERLCLFGSHNHEAFFRARANSILISADGAHAVHPNYADLHDPNHLPVLNGGPVIKINAQERYATTPEGAAHLDQCASRADVKTQVFVARTDMVSGSTIGPMTATRLGILTVDLGTPMLSMHSAREMGGSGDQIGLVGILVEHLSR